MAGVNTDKLVEEARNVLSANDRGHYTVPAGELYPHQWLWDSCFIAIGLRHIDIDRAQTELKSLVAAQWKNGMLPNIIFNDLPVYRKDRELWRSYVSPYSPEHIATSGITQPPMLAEAVLRVGEKMRLPERRSWYKNMYPFIVEYHEWLYRERNPHQEGLVVLLHPYESGLDNSPPWISELKKHSMPKWIRLIEQVRLSGLINLARRDTRHIPPGQRMSNIEALSYWAALRRLRRKAYNSEALLSRSMFLVEDLAFNSILVRANACLGQIAKTIKHDLPESLLVASKISAPALEQLWDETTGQYYSRSFISHKLIEEPTIATLLPLYAGTINKDRAKRLVELLKSSKYFTTPYPVPSVPRTSPSFSEYRYWQGPAWVNTNWLIIDGLSRYGYETEAELLRQRTLEMVDKAGMAEYFNPLNGQPVGAPDFSWTAALSIDLLHY